jgi:hypothetical protein
MIVSFDWMTMPLPRQQCDNGASVKPSITVE